MEEEEYYYESKNKQIITINCCLCDTTIDSNSSLIPSTCLIKNGNIKSHKICQHCWWHPISGFAKEESNHKCPGCVKN